MTDYIEAIILGLATGSVYSLSASGLVLTYTATGIFNFAHFAIVLFSGYVGWQLNGRWGVPMVVTVPVTLLVCGPGLGLLLERVVFRPLQLRRASSSEKLVAALGVTVLLLALVSIIWGTGVGGSTEEPVPRLFPENTLEVGGAIFDTGQVLKLATVFVVAAVLYVLLRRTFLGTQIRAVVDRRELAELAAIDANRVSQVAWMLGCLLAALTGLILAPPVLEPQRIIFTGIETFSIAVVARLISLPVAVGAGLLLTGVLPSVLDLFNDKQDIFGSPFEGSPGRMWSLFLLNISILLLFGALVFFKKLDEVGDSGTSGSGLVTAAFGRRRRVNSTGMGWAVVLGAAALLAPFFLNGVDLRQAQVFLALSVIFVSIVCITGYSGHLTLGQTAFAGLGAFFSARAVNGLGLPVLPATILGAVVAMLAGALVGYPALKRKGLFLGLTTLGFGLLIDRVVFNGGLEFFTGGPEGLLTSRPVLGPLSLKGDIAFYFYELAILGGVLFLARNLRSGRIGRILGAMRDSETASRSIGIDLRQAKLFVFGVSAFMAGLGGALLSQSAQTWDPVTYNPLFGLFWFVAVVVCGVSSTGGALLAAALYVAVPRLTGQDVQSAVGIFGILALFLGRLPGGLIARFGRARVLGQGILARAYREISEAQRAEAEPPPPLPEPSPFADRVLAEAQAARLAASTEPVEVVTT